MLQLHQRFMKFSTTNFFAELFQKSAIIFPEISGKIPQEIFELTTLVTFDLETGSRHIALNV